MKTITRYILGKFARIFGLCLVTVTTIYLVVDFFEKLRKFLKYDADLSLIFTFFGYRIPEIIYLLAPLVALMASILTVGGLNRTKEITAMRSCGMSFFQIGLPFFGFGCLVSVLGFILASEVIPVTNRQADYIQTVLIQNKPEHLSLEENRIWLRLGTDALIEIQSVQDDGLQLDGIRMYQLNQPFYLRTIVEGHHARFFQDRWVMEKVVTRRLAAGQPAHMDTISQQVLPLPLMPEDFRNWLAQSPELMTLVQLREYIQRLAHDGHSLDRYLTNYWSRIAYAVVPLVMTLLGIAVSFQGSGVRGVGVAKGLGQTLAIGFLFWAAHSLGVVLGQNGAIPPLIGSWIATLMFLMVGSNIFLKLK